MTLHAAASAGPRLAGSLLAVLMTVLSAGPGRACAPGGAVVGIGGSMFAISVGHLTPVSFDLTELIRQFAIIMVGGLGSLTGSVIGAAIITAAPQVFISFPGFDELVFGLLIVAMILFLPRGLASLLARLHPAFVERYYRD